LTFQARIVIGLGKELTGPNLRTKWIYQDRWWRCDLLFLFHLISPDQEKARIIVSELGLWGKPNIELEVYLANVTSW